MKETEILGFDTSGLSVFNQNENNITNISEEEIEKLRQEQDAWLEEEKKNLQQEHINNCIKNKPIFLNDPHVYLAGKISLCDWRMPIVGYRCGGLYGGDNVDITKYRIKYLCKNKNESTVQEVTITGPWFLACDHGCYHGDNSHGLGINKLGCNIANDDNYSEREVYDICLKQIDNSNLVFAYIDDDTCYGSIYEISYAISHDKYVVIIFANENLMSDMWFICQGADIVDVLKENQTIKEKFDEIITEKIIQ